MKKVWIKWVDAASYADRMPVDLALQKGPLSSETCGFILKEDDDIIIVGQTLFHRPEVNDELDNFIVIPKCWIKKRQDYK